MPYFLQMWKAGAIILAFRLAAVFALYQDEPLLYSVFPSNFRWATATASYQIEGAWNEDGRILSVAARKCHGTGPDFHLFVTWRPGICSRGLRGEEFEIEGLRSFYRDFGRINARKTRKECPGLYPTDALPSSFRTEMQKR